LIEINALGREEWFVFAMFRTTIIPGRRFA
jgi:hypothetical protein